MKTKFSLLKRIIALLLMVILITPSYSSSSVYAITEKDNNNTDPGSSRSPVDSTISDPTGSGCAPGDSNIVPGIAVTISEISGVSTLDNAIKSAYCSPFGGKYGVDFWENSSNWPLGSNFDNAPIMAFYYGGVNEMMSLSQFHINSENTTGSLTAYGSPYIEKYNGNGTDVYKGEFTNSANIAANMLKNVALLSGKSNISDILYGDITAHIKDIIQASSESQLWSITVAYIFGKSAIRATDINSIIDSVALSNNCESGLIELCMFTVSMYFVAEHTNSIDKFDLYLKNLNRDGSTTYYTLTLYEIGSINIMSYDGNNTHSIFAGTLGGFAKAMNASVDFIIRDQAGYTKDNLKRLIDHLYYWTCGDFEDMVTAHPSKHMSKGTLLGWIMNINNTGIPRIGEGKWKSTNAAENYNAPVLGYYTSSPNPYRGIAGLWASFDGEGSGLEIEVEPKDKQCELKSGLILDDNGKVKVMSSAVEAMLKSTSQISLTLTVRTCQVETQGLSNISAPINLRLNGKSGNGTVTTSLTYQDAMQLATGSTWGEFTHQVTSDGSKSAKQYYQAEATWVIDGITVKCEASKQAHDNPYICHDYASWGYQPPIKKDWFEYHSGQTPNAWSQIKANECKQEDWEVLEGIPSTENLFVAAGGQLFSIDVAGTFEHQENITRATTIQVNISNVWETMEPCELSCSGHKESKSWSGSVSSTGTGSTPGAKSEWTCPACNTKISVQAPAPGFDPIKDSKGNVIGQSPKSVTVSDSHTCDCWAEFNCETGAWAGGGSSCASNTGSKSDRFNQGYDGYSESTTPTGLKVRIDVSYPLIDEGYTVGKGHHNGTKHNHQHPQSRSYSWKFVENIPQILYLNITDYAVYGLCKTATTAVNGSILSSSANNQSALQEVGMTSWDIPSGNINDAVNPWAPYVNGNGRLYFTQYSNPTYKNGAGWKNSAAAGTDGTPYYWLGNSIIVINIEADDPNGGFTADGKSILAVRHSGGKIDGNFIAPSSSDNTWQNSKYTIGDYMTEQACINEAACVASQWMHQQSMSPESGHCLVVSDQLAVKAKDVSGWRSQDIVNAVYDMDNYWPIFGTGADSDKWGSGYCNVSNVNGVVRQNTYKVPAGITKDTLFSFASPYNFRAIFNDSDIMKLGFTGSPGSGHEGSNSYTEYCSGNKVKSVSGTGDGPTSLQNPSCMVAERSGSGWLTQSDLVMKGAFGAGAGEGSNYPYMSTNYRTRFQLESAGGSGGGESFEGFYDKYVYEAYGSDNLNQNKYGGAKVTAGLPNGVSATATNSTSANLTQYNVPMIMSAKFDINDWIENGEYSEPVTTTAWWCNSGSTTEVGGSPNWSQAVSRKQQPYVSASGAKIGYNGLNTPINSVVIHDPVSVEGCYFISQDIYDPGDDDRVDTLPDTQHKLKKDYLTAGNTFYVWVSDIANMYDSSGSWGASCANSKLGTGTSGNLFATKDSTSFSSLKSSYRYNNGDAGDGYMNSMYTTKWIYDRYVRFPFAVTFYDTSSDTIKTAAANEWISLSCVSSCAADFSTTYQKFTVNNNSGGSSGPDAYRYPFMNSPDGGDGNAQNMGWMFEFYSDTSMLESNNAKIEFGVVANNNPNKGNTAGPVNVTVTGLNAITNNNVNNGNRSGVKAPYTAIKNCYLDLVGRIGNLTIEDAGDFRFSELFKVKEDSWLIDGVVHNTLSNKPYKVVADNEDIFNDNAGATTNGHATTSVMYKEDTNSAGNRVKVGKADCDFIKLPITPSDNNVKDFKSEAMRMGYSLYMDIDTIGNYYGINQRLSSVNENPDGTLAGYPTTISSYDDNDESKGVGLSNPNYYKRTYTTNVDIRYFLLDLDTSEYVPIDVYYGEDGQRKVCFQWNKQLWSDWKQYIELENEFNRRNGTQAERDATLSGNNFLNTWKYNPGTDASNHASNPFEYSRDFIGYADQLILDQKDRTFIGSSLIRCDMISKGNGLYNVRTYATEAFSWLNNLLGKNTSRLAQQRDSYSHAGDWDINYIYWSSADNNNYKMLNAKYGLSEQEYAAQSQRWHMCIGLPSTAYVVPAQNGPVMNGTTGTKNYLSAYVSGATNYNSQLVLEKAHEALLKKHPNSVVVCAVDITSQGEVWKLRYNSNSNNKQFTVYDGDAEEQPSSIRDKKYNYPKGFEDWTIVSVYEPEYTSYDDLSIYGTH